MQLLSTYSSPIGTLTLATTDSEREIAGLWVEGQKFFGATLGAETVSNGSAPVLTSAKRWLDRYFEGLQPDPAELELRPQGTEFRQLVWQILLEIPSGSTTTYAQISRLIAERRGINSMSSQAVGGAVGHNPISVIIPCHRVIGTTGSLVGYAGGLEVKRALLQHEGVDLSGL